MSHLAAILSSWKLRNILFVLLLLIGIVPLAISGLMLVGQNSEIVETQEKSYLARSALFLSMGLNDYLVESRRNLQQLGRLVVSLSTEPGSDRKVTEDDLRKTHLGKGTGEGDWLSFYLKRYLDEGPLWTGLRVLDSTGQGPYSWGTSELDPGLLRALDSTYLSAASSGDAVWKLVSSSSEVPFAVLTAPFTDDLFDGVLFLQGVFEIRPLAAMLDQEGRDDVAVFLIDHRGQMLWFKGADTRTSEVVADSDLVRDFAEFPLNLTAEYTLDVDGEKSRMVARVSPVDEPRWGVVLHKPTEAAFRAVEKMLFNTLVATAIVVVLSLFLAGLAARRISGPISRLAESTKEIAAGNFTKRIEATGPGVEIGELAQDFNRMSGHLNQHIHQLERAAQANRELFIGSMRAFVAAVDAKDPYTRGHSERVAAHSRTIARYLGLTGEAQHRVWVGALLHDVGKIGVDDNILRKGGVLSAEEYDQMKEHPVIGAEILSRIEQLREMIPAIRWHHEAWAGGGYPDGRKGEQIPLMARIVAVADTFDAITTSRPYQRAYEVEFALETIRKLAGTRFDAKVVTAFLRAVDAGEVQLRRDANPQVQEVSREEANVAT